MAAENYASALTRVLAHEGGYSSHPRDPGGATMKGVTQRVYDAYRERRGAPKAPVKAITTDELSEIYRTQYAKPIQFDRLPAGVDYCVFDGAVNSGPSQSVKWLQRALGVPDDGIVGNVTLAKAEAHPSKSALIAAICDQRLAFLKRLKTWNTFGKGWTARVQNVRVAAQAMARGSNNAPMRIMLAEPAEAAAPALPEDLAKPKAPVVVPTIGSAAGAIAVALNEARDQITPFAGTMKTVDLILSGLTVAGVVVAVFGIGYGVYAKVQRDRIKAVA